MYSNLTSQISLTLTDRKATLVQVEDLCTSALSNKFYSVCVPPLFVKKAKELLAGSSIKVCTVIGFPYGYNAIEAKLAEIVLAIVDGADELDMVINMTALSNADWQYLARELSSVLPIVQKQHTALTIVIESNLVSPEDLVKCCDLYGAAGVQNCSLSTGIEAALPGLQTVGLLRQHLADSVGIKVTGIFKDEVEMKLYGAAGAGYLGVQGR
jgi:deoxyribose-phosphate aldolase